MKRTFLKIIVVIFWAYFSTLHGQYLSPSDSNMTLLNREPNGYCQTLLPVSSKYLLAGSGRGIRVIDYSDAEHPRMISQIKTEARVSGIVLNNNYVYIATDSPYGAFSEGFYIADISDITNPKITFYKSISPGVFAIANDGNYVYLGGSYNIYVYDASNPSNPKKVNSIYIPGVPHGLFVKDKKLYVTAQSGGLIIYDISNPASPQKLGTLNHWAEKCAVKDTLVFLTRQGDTPEIISVKDPSNPYVVSELKTDSAMLGAYLMDVRVRGNTIYVVGDITNKNSETGAAVEIVDISNPSKPKVLNTFINNPNIGSPERGTSIRFLNNKCFVAIGDGFQIFDISNSPTISLLSEYFTYRDEGRIKMFGNYPVMVYSTLRDSIIGFSVYEVTPSYKIIEKSCTNIKGEGGNFDIAIDGNLLAIDETNYITYDTVSAIHLFNLSADGQATKLGLIKPTLELEENTIALHNNLLCFMDRTKDLSDDSLRIIDVSDPQHPVEAGGFRVDLLKYSHINKMEFYNNYLITANENLVLVLNLSTPSVPSIVTSIKYDPNIYDCNGLKIKNQKLYLAQNEGFEIFNIANPASISSEFHIHTNKYYYDIDYYNGDVILSSIGVNIYSINSDSTLTPEGYFNTKIGYSMGIQTNNGNIYVSYNGLHIFKKGVSTGVQREPGIEPEDYSLSQNYPNPFNPTTTIEYSIAKHSGTQNITNERITLRIYDILGREIKTLVDRKMVPGKYSVKFNGANLPSGIYFYRLSGGNFSITKKMILMK